MTRTTEHYAGVAWCPSTRNQTIFVRHDGTTFWSGNSHAGKTQLINSAICNNRDRRILFFSMDDPAEMILIKLTCMQQGVDAETLERHIRDDEQDGRKALRRAATSDFSKLIVVDESMGLGALTKAVEEATDYWGAPPECVFIDYLQSLEGNGSSDDEDGGVRQKIQGIKRWVKNKPFPTVVVHQNTRSKGGPGARITMTSGAYGGEQQSTMLIGVRRKRDDEDLDQWERDQNENTVTLHIVKNKRPPCKVTPIDGVDFFMSPTTGAIRLLRDEDLSAGATSAANKIHKTAEGAMSALADGVVRNGTD